VKFVIVVEFSDYAFKPKACFNKKVIQKL